MAKECARGAYVGGADPPRQIVYVGDPGPPRKPLRHPGRSPSVDRSLGAYTQTTVRATREPRSTGRILSNLASRASPRSGRQVVAHSVSCGTEHPQPPISPARGERNHDQR
jgi:hypothetical protein